MPDPSSPPFQDFYKATATLFFTMGVAGVIQTRLIEPKSVASDQAKRRWGAIDVALLVVIMTLVAFGLIISLGGISGIPFSYGDRHVTTIWLLAITGGVIVAKVIIYRLLEAGWLKREKRHVVNVNAMKLVGLAVITGVCASATIVLLVYWGSAGWSAIPGGGGLIAGFFMWRIASKPPG